MINQADYGKLREKLGLTREDVASRLRVSATTVYRWETGRSVPHAFLKKELEKIFPSRKFKKKNL